MALFQVRYTNKSAVPLPVSGWTNHAYSIPAAEGGGALVAG